MPCWFLAAAVAATVVAAAAAATSDDDYDGHVRSPRVAHVVGRGKKASSLEGGAQNDDIVFRPYFCYPTIAADAFSVYGRSRYNCLLLLLLLIQVLRLCFLLLLPHLSLYLSPSSPYSCERDDARP